MGYAIPVDGKMGPLTRSAIRDWESGKGSRNPDKWSANLRRVSDPNTTNSGVNQNNQRNQPAHSRSNNLKPVNNRPGVKPAGRNFGSGMDGLLSNEDLDVDVLANAMVESEYGPILAEIQRQERRVRESGPERLNQIDRIYADLQGSIRSRNTANADISERLQRGTETAATSLAGALGLEAADPSVLATVGANTSIERDFLRDISAADAQFGNNLLAGAASGQASAREAAMAEDRGLLEELTSQRAELTANRGNDLLKARMQALELQQNLKSSRLKDRLALFQAQMAAKMAPIEQQRALQQLLAGDLGLQMDQARLNNLLNPPKKPPTEPIRRNFGQLAPDERLDLQNAILGAIQPGMKTQQTVRLINSRLRAAGYNPFLNNKVKQFAFDTARAAGLYPSRRWWGTGRRP